MLQVTCKVDTSSTDRWLELVLKDQIQFATALALTKTAQAVKADLADAMRNIFAHPRKYTLNSLAIKRATKQSLVATVYIRSTSVDRSLKAEIRGGYRDKAIEKVLGSIIPSGAYVVPGSEAKLDADGKLSISWVKSLVVKLGGQGARARTKRRYRSNTAGPVFLLPERDGRLLPGIYQRKGRNVLPLLIFVKRPSYGARFNFERLGADSAQKHFAEEFEKAAEAALRTAR